MSRTVEGTLDDAAGVEQQHLLLSPEIARLPPPTTPGSISGKHRDASSEYYTAAWGSPYERSPSSRSARTARSEQLHSEQLSTSSPGPDFGLEHLIPSRLVDFASVEPRAPSLESTSNESHQEDDPDLTPRSRTKRWVQLPRREDDKEKVQWWSDESRHSSPGPDPTSTVRSSSLSPTREKSGSAFGHRSRESNRTLDQQTFWENIRERKTSDMSSMYASRWAATPPAEEESSGPTIDQQMNAGLAKSRWAATSPPPEVEEKKVQEGLSSSRWADTPPPPEVEENQVHASHSSSRWADTPPPPEVEEMQIQQDLASRWAKSPSAQKNDRLKDGGEDAGAGAEREGKRSVEPVNGMAASDSTDDEFVDAGVIQQPVMQPSEIEVADESQSLKETGAGESVAQEARPETPVWTIDGAAGDIDSSLASAVTKRSPTKKRQEATRLKKKVSWRNKVCTVFIPDFDYASIGRLPISLEEANARLREFEAQGLDVEGFDTAPEHSSNGAIHVKPIYPDEAELEAAGRQNGPKVVLPDLNRWEAYEAQLMEQKLAALGVSLGGDEPTSSGGTNMSRQSSGQYPPLPFSPPLPPSSTTSLGRPGMIRGHSHTMSVASPISPIHGPMGHMRTQSNFTGALGFQQISQQAQQMNLPGLRAFSPPMHHLAQQSRGPAFSPKLQQPMVPGFQSFSPRGQFVGPQSDRTGSPAQMAALRHDLGGVRGPGSPLNHQLFAQSPHGFSFNQASPVQATGTPHAASLQPASSLPELAEEDEEDEAEERGEPVEAVPAADPEQEPSTYVPPHKRAELNANIAVPTPRGHRHNISEGFERDIIEAEQRHEAQRQDWIEVTMESDTTPTDAERSTRTVSPSKPDEFGPSEKDPLSQDITVQESAHNHKRSGSRFNGPTSPIKFNPTASFQPSSTAFAFGASAPKASGLPSLGHNRNKSSAAFNVTAPVFRPAAAEFKPAGVPAMPRSDFSFSSNGPTFKPNAAPFQPAIKSTDNMPALIFGKVEIPDVIKPARRSKAVAIVRPEDDAPKSASASDVEDEGGRITQSDDRLKRQRKVGGDGDEVPRFAEPTPMPTAPEETLKPQPAEASFNKDPLVADVDHEASEGIDDDWTLPHPSEVADPSLRAHAHGHRHSSSLSALAKPFEPFGAASLDSLPTHESKLSFASISELEEGEIRDEDGIPSPASNGPAPLTYEDASERAVSPLPDQTTGFDHLPSARIDTIGDVEPSFDEIDAVMRRLNEVSVIQDARDIENVSPMPSTGPHPMDGVTYLPTWSRSDAPSPSPKRRDASYNPQADSSFTIHDRTDSGETPMTGWPHVSRLNKNDDAPTSDWSGVFSAQDEEKLQRRGQFFDSHIDELIGSVVERRLQPLEDSLRTIQHSIAHHGGSRDLAPKRSSSNVESDADDEDDSEQQLHRPISRGRDKRIDQIRAAVFEAMRDQASTQHEQSSRDIQELHSVLADMKISFARAASASLELEDIRAVVEDTFNKQSHALVPFGNHADTQSGAHKREVSELEGRLDETLAGALEEANRRHAAEEREVETKRMLRLAEEELQLLRHSARDDDSRLQAAEQEREDLFRRAERAEDAQRDMEDQVKSLEAEHEAAQATLEEYRMSSHNWRQDIDQAASDREDLENTIAGLERELEDSQEMGGSMRRRLEKLHSDMATAAGQLASEKASWQAKEETYRATSEELRTQQKAQLEDRSRFEEELLALRAGSSEIMEMKVAREHLQLSNSSLEDTIRKLQTELVEQQSIAARSERDFNDARESGRSEIDRTRVAMAADIETANHQVNVVRVEMEGELANVRAELANVKTEAENTKARHGQILEDEDAAKREAIRKVNHASSVAFDEARQKHDATVQDLHSAHSRALNNSVEDKQRSEYFLNERLALSDAKVQHFQDRVLHLEERLEVTKSAAQAAAMKAQSRGVATTSSSSLPERISPQALRESILVLQEQLQEREARIEKLQSQAEDEGPAEMKKRDDEISFLRELLAVRSEELTHLVNTLAQPTFDRAAVRDTAIRIRANLQMEQQEKERFGQAPASLPGQAIASLSSFATPKAAQLGAAFSKWRTTMESSALRTAPPASGRLRSSTPSKPSYSASKMPPGYAAGLMTPPASNLRSTPSPEAMRSLPAPLLRADSIEGKGGRSAIGAHSRQRSNISDVPTTPLFRSQSYDNDAEDSNVHMQSFEDETLDVADNEPPAFRSLEAELDDAGDDGDVA